MKGAEEAAPHFSHLLTFLGPKGSVGKFCLYTLVCKVAYAVAKGRVGVY